jgi:hypothetical protein
MSMSCLLSGPPPPRAAESRTTHVTCCMCI